MEILWKPNSFWAALRLYPRGKWPVRLRLKRHGDIVSGLHNLKGKFAMTTHKNMGKIWKNPTKKEDKHPDLKGYIWIDGVKFDIGGWQRDEEGRTFYSLSARQYENPDNQGIAKTVARGGSPRVQADGYQSAHDLNDAIPF